MPGKSKGPGTILFILALLLAVAGGSAWFIHKILSGEDPVAVLTQSATGQPVSPPPGDATPAGQASGLPGLSPRDQAAAPQAPGQDGGPMVVYPPSAPHTYADPAQLPPPATREDPVVRPAFVTDMAAFLVQNYWPKGTHPAAGRSGITTASLRWANLRYGAELQGLDRRGDPRQARAAVLAYVLDPAAITRLYTLYADEFMAALLAEAGNRKVGQDGAGRALTTAEKKEMFVIYANYAARVGNALEKYAADPAMPARVKAFAEAEQAVQNANRAYMESMLAHEEAREKSASGLTGARLRMDKDAATYQKRVREREAARERLVAAMSRAGAPRAASDDTLIYAAFWAYRRGPGSAPALTAGGKALNSMSARLAAAAQGMR